MQIAIKNLSKVFTDGTPALSHVTLDIHDGIFGLLGPNASGKTTLMRILATLSAPTGGTVSVDGLDLARNRAAIRSMTGYLPQRFSSFTRITAWEFLDYTARLAGLRDKKSRAAAVDDMLDSLGLYAVRNRMANELSVAMKRHLEIAQAVIGNPKILIVDEPTVGLSPEERLRFRKLLADKVGKINIIILSTHILGDISSSCGTIAILNRGEIVFTGSPDSLLEQVRMNGRSTGVSDDELNSIKTTYSVIAAVEKLKEGKIGME